MKSVVGMVIWYSFLKLKTQKLYLDWIGDWMWILFWKSWNEILPNFNFFLKKYFSGILKIMSILTWFVHPGCSILHVHGSHTVICTSYCTSITTKWTKSTTILYFQAMHTFTFELVISTIFATLLCTIELYKWWAKGIVMLLVEDRRLAAMVTHWMLLCLLFSSCVCGVIRLGSLPRRRRCGRSSRQLL